MQTASNKKHTLKNMQSNKNTHSKTYTQKDNMSHIHTKHKNISIDEDNTQTLIRVIEHDLGDYNW